MQHHNSNNIQLNQQQQLQLQQQQLQQQQQQQQQHMQQAILCSNYGFDNVPITWCCNTAPLQQQQQQQHMQQPPHWLAVGNKQQQQLICNNNNDNNSNNLNYQLLLQQQYNNNNNNNSSNIDNCANHDSNNYQQQMPPPSRQGYCYMQQQPQQQQLQQQQQPASRMYVAAAQNLLQQQQQQHFQQQQQQQQQQQNMHAHAQIVQAHQRQQQQQQLQRQLQRQRRLVSLDGIQNNVPTLTTPTLTPTTLRSIEETFLQLTNEPANTPNQAGFKPPPLAPLVGANTTAAANNFNNVVQNYACNILTDSEDSQASWNGAQLIEDNTTTDTSSAATDSTTYGLNNVLNNTTTSNGGTNDFSAIFSAAKAVASIAKNSSLIASTTTATTTNGGIHMVNNSNNSNNSNTSNSATSINVITTTATTSTISQARRGGGRRPTKATNMSPEEEEKRRIRRERNKLAAARCRKRRVDQTNELLEEVAVLEKKREGFQTEIEQLTNMKAQLEYVLNAHRPTCQKIREDLLSVTTFNGLIAPTNSNSNDSNTGTITGLDATLNSTGRSNSPIDLKPVLIDNNLLQQIKNEPLDAALDSDSSLDHDGPPSPKRLLFSNNNTMVTPLPNIATLTASLTTPTGPIGGSSGGTAILNTPIVSVAPVNFNTFAINSAVNTSTATNVALNALHKSIKPRPNSLPTAPRNFGQNLNLNVDGKMAPTEIQGVPIQTPSTGMFNFDSLMDGGTGLTPVSGPLVPTCSSQNKHPLELPTPTSEPSKLVSL